MSYDDNQWRPAPGLQSYEGHEMWTHHVGPHQVDGMLRDDDDVETVFRRVYEENDEFDGEFDEEFGHLFDGDGDGAGDD